jgi:predicted GNAT family acetyltransferase
MGSQKGIGHLRTAWNRAVNAFSVKMLIMTRRSSVVEYTRIYATAQYHPTVGTYSSFGSRVVGPIRGFPLREVPAICGESVPSQSFRSVGWKRRMNRVEYCPAVSAKAASHMAAVELGTASLSMPETFVSEARGAGVALEVNAVVSTLALTRRRDQERPSRLST